VGNYVWKYQQQVPEDLRATCQILGRFSIHFCKFKRFKNGKVFLDAYVKDNVSLSIYNAAGTLMKLRRNNRETHKMYHSSSRQF